MPKKIISKNKGGRRHTHKFRSKHKKKRKVPDWRKKQANKKAAIERQEIARQNEILKLPIKPELNSLVGDKIKIRLPKKCNKPEYKIDKLSQKLPPSLLDRLPLSYKNRLQNILSKNIDYNALWSEIYVTPDKIAEISGEYPKTVEEYHSYNKPLIDWLRSWGDDIPSYLEEQQKLSSKFEIRTSVNLV